MRLYYTDVIKFLTFSLSPPGKWVWGESMRFFEAFWVTTFGLFSMMILGLISFEQYSRFVRQQQLKTHQVRYTVFIEHPHEHNLCLARPCFTTPR